MNGEDHLVMGAERVEGSKHGRPDPVEDLSQLADEGQGGRRSWIKLHHQEAEDQGSQEALFEGQGKAVAHSRVPKSAKQHQ